ncbi:MAG: hypothetical protein ACLPKB_13170 [Xanthobacteraceae bacterium]
MTQTISVFYSLVEDRAFHMAIVYDQGDGSDPLVIEAGPQIKYGEGTNEQNEQQTTLAWSQVFYGDSVQSSEFNSPFGSLAVNPPALANLAYPNGLGPGQVLIQGDDLSSQWATILNLADWINVTNYSYLPMQQNSNTFVSTALEAAGIPLPSGLVASPSGFTNFYFTPGETLPLSVTQGNSVAPFNSKIGDQYLGQTQNLLQMLSGNGAVVSDSAGVGSGAGSEPIPYLAETQDLQQILSGNGTVSPGAGTEPVLYVAETQSTLQQLSGTATDPSAPLTPADVVAQEFGALEGATNQFERQGGQIAMSQQKRSMRNPTESFRGFSSRLIRLGADLFYSSLQAKRLQSHLSGRKIAHLADQAVVRQGPSHLPNSQVGLIICTLAIHEPNRIEPVSPVSKPGNLVTARPVYPVQALVSNYDALAEKYSQVKNDIESQPSSRPGFRKLKKNLTRCVLAQVGNKGAAIPGAPSRNCGKPLGVNPEFHTKCDKECTERGQSRITVFDEVGEVVFAACREFPEQAHILFFTFGLQTAGPCR